MLVAFIQLITEMFFVLFSLTLQQIQLCQARQKLLTYLDRLASYEIILGGASIADEHFDSVFFHEFRQKNIVKAALEFARVSVSEAQ